METPEQIVPRREMRVMDGSGDTKIIWDSGNPDEVANARRTFDDLLAKRYLAFSVTKLGNKGEQIRKFDADAEKLIMVPQLKGG